MRIALATLGCKMNQYESSLIRDDLSSGYILTSFDKEAEVYIINTCTVTHKADYQSRQLIRHALKRNNDAQLIATGCYAERAPGELKSLGVHAVIGNKAKNSISDIIDNLLRGHRINGSFDTGDVRCKATSNSGRTRAFLKIQDGCNYECSYCIVPSVRGRSLSAQPSNVYKEFKELIERGYREVVLSGIQLGSYGRDLEPKTDLPGLLEDLLNINGKFRIRLSSIEPQDVTSQLINVMKSDQRICRHLHIPLQSGDDEILKSMGRNYDSFFYKDLINTLLTEIPGIGVGTDIIVGFPGEENKHFFNTYTFLSELPLSYLHTFSYSSRPGTSASVIKNKVSGLEKKHRSSVLRYLGDEKKLLFRNNNLKKELKVLIENKSDSYGKLSGLTDNYIRLSLKASKDFIGEIITIQANEDYTL